MSDTVRVVETRFVPKDETSSALERIARTAEKTDDKLNEVSSVISMIAGAGGSLVAALSLESATEATTEYLRSLQRVKTETNLTLQKAAGLKEALQVGGGLEGGEAERVLLSMSRKAQQFHRAMDAAVGPASHDQLAKLGVDLRKGPEESLLKMSELAKEGKINVGMLSRGLAVRSTASVSLMTMLKKGPETLKEMMEDAPKISDATMTIFTHMQMMRREIKSSWEKIGIAIGVQIMPVAERLMQSVKDRMDGWVHTAEHFGKILGDHLEGALGTVTTIGKVLLANAALRRVTGSGLVGGGMRLGGWLLPGGRLLNPRKQTEAGPAQFSMAALDAAVARSREHKAFSWMNQDPRAEESGPALSTSRKIAERWGVIRGHASVTASKMRDGFDRVKPALSGIAKFIGATAGALLAAGAIRGIMEGIEGKETKAGSMWRETFGYLENIGIETDNIFGPDGDFMTFFANASAWLANMTAKYSAKASSSIAAASLAYEAYGQRHGVFGKVAANLPFIRMFTVGMTDEFARLRDEQEGIQSSIDKQAQEARAKHRALNAGAGKAPSERESAPVYDFRNSRFDILQKFEEGFDPDRIATAFADDVAALGERAVQSGFASLYSVPR